MSKGKASTWWLAALTGLALSGFAPNADASIVSDRQITEVVADGPVFVRFRLNGAAWARPACNQGWLANDYIFNATTNAGKTMLQVVNAAFLAGKTVTVQGTGACDTASPVLNIVEVAAVVYMKN